MTLEQAIKLEIAAFENAIRTTDWANAKRTPSSVFKARNRLTDFIKAAAEPLPELVEEEDPTDCEDPVFNPEQHDAEAL